MCEVRTNETGATSNQNRFGFPVRMTGYGRQYIQMLTTTVPIGRRTTFSPYHIEETPLFVLNSVNDVEVEESTCGLCGSPYVSVLASHKNVDREEIVRKSRDVA